MRTTLFLLLTSLLIVASGCSVAGNSEAVVLDTIEPGVQKVTPLVDRNTFMPGDNSTAPWYRVYDDQTKQWYPAEKDSSGAWVPTKEGKQMRADDLKALSTPDEDKVTDWRNDTTGFIYNPSLRSTNATGSGVKVHPTPQLDLERQNATNTTEADDAKDMAVAEDITAGEDTAVAEDMTAGAENEQVLWDDSGAEDSALADNGGVEDPAPAADTAAEASPQPTEREMPFAETSAADTAPATSSPATVEVPSADAPAAAMAAETSTPATVREVSFANASTMTLEGYGPTWVTALIDGSEKQDYYIRDGETININFGSSLKLEVGNAHSVRFTLDGDPYPVSSSGKATISIP